VGAIVAVEVGAEVAMAVGAVVAIAVGAVVAIAVGAGVGAGAQATKTNVATISRPDNLKNRAFIVLILLRISESNIISWTSDGKP
jgi:hypothetical protein